MCAALCCSVFFQAEDGIRDLVRSRGLGDGYKRQGLGRAVQVEARDVEGVDRLDQQAQAGRTQGIRGVAQGVDEGAGQHLALLHI